MRKPLDFVLGTAMWGWSVGSSAAFEMLDLFYEKGHREVDAATNYPIDRDPAHFRLAEKILAEWLAAHGVSDLKIIQKVASVNNLRTPEVNLNKSFLLLLKDEYLRLFGKNLACLMLHWDNRDDRAEIEKTFEAMVEFRKSKLSVGLSGIKFPEIYSEVNAAFGLDFTVEVKHNPLQTDLLRYQIFSGKSRFLAYGINAGGLKLPGESKGETLEARGGKADLSATLFARLKNPPDGLTMNRLGLLFAAQTPDIQGVVLGCSSAGQLRESLEFGATAHLHPPIELL